MDEIDREIVRLLQEDASLTARELAEHVGLTATPVWRRVQILEGEGVITSRVALVDPEAIGLGVTVMVHVRTNDHSAAWLDRFATAIEELPEITEAYRISGEIDYTLKVVVPSIDAYDDFYRRLISKVELYDVRSVFVMEEIKRTTALPLHFLPAARR
ncbi:MAG: Lrp/AsnC family transcriptional regulator [Actinomycetota bacterium]